MRRRLAFALAVLAAPAAAQSLPERMSPAADIPVEQWSDMAMGRTLTYTFDGAFWALEHYHPGTNRVTLERYDGRCLEGTWDYSAPNYCFHWDGEGTVCFRHARIDGEILVIEQQDGADTPMVQEMIGVTDTPLACGPALTS